MLKLLRRIVQEIADAQDFRQALQMMVSRIRDAMETEACTIFLLDQNSKEFVLMATEGLNKEFEGSLRLNLGQGLIGLVAEREEPLNLENALNHPLFSYFPELGEDKFNAFLGVPIIHHRELYGVILVQQQESRKYDESEEAFLVTLSAQLGGIIAHAETNGTMAILFQQPDQPVVVEEICLEGIAGSPGVGIGQAVIIFPLADLEAVPDRNAENIEHEINLFKQALANAREDIENLAKKFSESLPAQEQALFSAYLSILDDNAIGQEVIKEIEAGNWSQGALRKVIKRHIRQFENLEDVYFSERASDIRDLGLRVLSHLQEQQQPLQEYPEQTVLVAEQITAADLAQVPEGRLQGIVSVSGSSNSHVAILAKAMGIPAVMGVEGLNLLQIPLEHKEVIVDGYYGQVYISPSPELLLEFQILVQEEKELDTNLTELRNLPAVTPDGRHVSLFVNTGLAADAGLALSVGAEGVGLFRTEVPFMVRERFPAEEEQRILYTQLLKAFAPRPVIMRTLDIGGDKQLPYFPIHEENPFLGWRGIRITLDHPDVFLIQIKAMLKAGHHHDNLRILLPMVTLMKELDDSIELIDQAIQELREEGQTVIKPPIGVMIEVPAAIHLIKHFAKKVDFFSVGSNDLTQYVLAVDRNNSKVASMYEPLHPAVIQTLAHITELCRQEAKPISICGEMASDPAAVVLLLAMGFDALSMNSVSLLRMKWIIRTVPLKKAQEILQEVLQMDDPNRIRYYLEQFLEKAGLGGLVRAGK